MAEEQTELIAIREAARRLGVSDTAVRKAIKAGRVRVAAQDPKTGSPLMAWPQTLEQWQANTDPMKRSHVGSATKPAKQAQQARVRLGTSAQGGDPDAPAAGRAAQQPLADDTGGRGPSYAQSRAVREAYAARLLKLEHDERIGKLVSVDMLKVEAFKAHRRIRDALLNIPDRLAPELAAISDPLAIHAALLGEITETLRMLAADLYAPPGGSQ